MNELDCDEIELAYVLGLCVNCQEPIDGMDSFFCNSCLSLRSDNGK